MRTRLTLPGRTKPLDCPINLTVMMPSAVPDHHNQQVPVVDGAGQQQHSGGGGGAATALDAAANKKATNVLYYSHNNGTGTGLQPPPGIPPQSTINANNDNASTFNLLRRLANSQFQNYNTALTVTVVVGCFLLLLNVLIFVGIYYQREKRVKEARRKDELVELDCQQQQQQLASSSSGGGSVGGGLISGRSPEKNGHKSGDGMTTQGHKGSFQSVRNFGNFNEYRCYDEKNFQQQHHHPQQQQHQHFGSRHHLHNHHHSHGSLNRKYLVDVCHNVPNGNGSVADLHHFDTVMYAGDYSPSAALGGSTMSREHSVSSSHIAHNGGVVGSNLSLHQSQQQLHHHHHHTCQSRRHSLVTEGTQSDPISLKDLEYETGGASSGNQKQQQQNAAKKKGVLLVGGLNKKKGCDLADCRGTGDTVTGGTQTDGADCNIEDDEDPEGEEEDEEEEGEEEEEDDESPDIPDPPPPPRGILTGGILRTHTSNAAKISAVGRDSPPTTTSSFGGGGGGGGSGLPNANSGSNSHAGNSSTATPSATKKRVQIQEISV